jgi:hypothetical protein
MSYIRAHILILLTATHSSDFWETDVIDHNTFRCHINCISSTSGHFPFDIAPKGFSPPIIIILCPGRLTIWCNLEPNGISTADSNFSLRFTNNNNYLNNNYTPSVVTLFKKQIKYTYLKNNFLSQICLTLP